MTGAKMVGMARENPRHAGDVKQMKGRKCMKRRMFHVKIHELYRKSLELRPVYRYNRNILIAAEKDGGDICLGRYFV